MTTMEAVLDQIWVRGEDDSGGFGSVCRAWMGEACACVEVVLEAMRSSGGTVALGEE